MNIDSADPEPPNLQPTYAECFAPITYPMDGLHTQQTMVCADQSSLYFSPTPMDDSKNPSPNPSHSGSSAHNSSDCTDEDTFERDEELSSFPSSESPQDHGFISDASPICVLESEITYGVDRLIFVEELIWNCTSQFHTIYGELINEPRPPPGHPLDVLVHEGLVHGLCNEIVILPVMAAIQKTQGDPTQHQADQIPFPLFVAEMLRRMRASYFLFRTAMQYVLDIERQIQMARERSKCGWCLSGVYGCSHFDAPERSVASRFSKGRTAINRKPKSGVPGVIPASHFTKSDPLFPLADPRKAFLGALILANKFHRDRSIGNKSWATLIGLSLEEVHSAERAVGQALGWTLSRPWVSNEKDSNGLPMFGPIHATFSEPLFATTEIEVDRYGVRELREQGNLPPPLKLPPMIAALSSERAVASLMESDGILHPSRSLRRIRSQQHLGDERRIAPLPQRQQSLNTPKLGNPIKKASSAPFVLQPHASGYGDGPHPFHEEMIDAVVMSDWGAYSSGPQGADGWMDATPTLEQYRSKRKASHDFGPKALFRRGDQGQRMRVFSPDVSTQSGTASASLSNPSQSQWDMCDMEEDGIPPELSIDTPTASSPSEGPLTRTSTPANLNAVAMGEYGSPGSNSWKFQPLSRTLSSSRIHGSYSSTHHTKLAHGSLPGASMNALHQ